jgi:hypothetical protein
VGKGGPGGSRGAPGRRRRAKRGCARTSSGRRARSSRAGLGAATFGTVEGAVQGDFSPDHVVEFGRVKQVGLQTIERSAIPSSSVKYLTLIKRYLNYCVEGGRDLSSTC